MERIIVSGSKDGETLRIHMGVPKAVADKYREIRYNNPDMDQFEALNQAREMVEVDSSKD